jgi:hypothetical protein
MLTYFSQIFISLFQELFNDEIDLRVRYRWKSCNSGGGFLKMITKLYCGFREKLNIDIQIMDE